MPSRKIEPQLELLCSLKQSGASVQAAALVEKSLADPVALVVAKAAGVAAELRLTSLTPSLMKAYDRLFDQGAKRDQQCWGKIAIAKALKELDHTEAEPFLRGFAYHQFEPIWGGEADTAGALRAVCVLTLVQCTDLLRDEKLWHLMRGLADAEPAVRMEAARALEQLEGKEAALLLRLKARMGDRDLAITEQVLESILAIEGQSAIPFVAEFLYQRDRPDKDEELMEHAALALGASRLPKALDVLIGCWQQRSSPALSATLLRSISASRQEPALEFLVSLISSARKHDALAALEALSLHQNSENISARVRTSIEDRDDADLGSAFKRLFPAVL